jgi:hypothetical protein
MSGFAGTVGSVCAEAIEAQRNPAAESKTAFLIMSYILTQIQPKVSPENLLLQSTA